jgi:RimJ/RimL family protein N-acetyltransferase
MNISIRPLKPADMQAFKAIRLKALQAHKNVYLGKYEDAITRPDFEWLEMLDQKGKCIFGLYDVDKMIGLTAVFTWKEDPKGETGVLAMSYIEPEYRKLGLSRHFYEARIHWALQHLPWKKLVVGHREGNEASRRAMIGNGFKFTNKKKILWPDGIEDWEYNYELDLVKLR